MSAEWRRAAVRRRESARSAGQPARARAWLVSRATAFSALTADTAVELGLGAEAEPDGRVDVAGRRIRFSGGVGSAEGEAGVAEPRVEEPCWDVAGCSSKTSCVSGRL